MPLVARRIGEDEGDCAGGIGWAIGCSVVCVCGCVACWVGVSVGGCVIGGLIAGAGGSCDFLGVGIDAGWNGAGGLAVALIQALWVEIFPGCESVACGLEQGEFVEAVGDFARGGVVAFLDRKSVV